MLTILLHFLTHASALYAGEKIHLGTFSLATEAGWTAVFTLEGKGRATITASFDTENFDSAVKNVPRPKPVLGTWREMADGIQISYAGVTDHFKFERGCRGWNEYPCFRIKAPVSQKSRLNYPQPYINWDWKNPEKIYSEPPTKECTDQCNMMIRDGAIQKGLDLEGCQKVICQ